MKKRLLSLATLFCVFSIVAQAAAVESVWYDAVRQAIGFDPYYDGPKGTMEFDFNDDPSWAAIVKQGSAHYLYGFTTELGLYKATVYPVGRLMQYGWGERLGTLNPEINFSTDVTALYYGAEAPDQFHYFTDVWNVEAGQTSLYLQPIVDGQPVPVLPADLDNTYFRQCDGVSHCTYADWQSLADLNRPPPIEVQIGVRPKTINLKSVGSWVSVHIDLPAGHVAGEIDPSTITLAVGTSQEGPSGVERASSETVVPMEIVDENDDGRPGRIVKFDRRALISQLAPGAVEIVVSGQLYSGEDFLGSEIVSAISPGTDKCRPSSDLD
jgi:hypothetical protein